MSLGSWTGGTPTLEWLRDGASISGAVNTTYVLTAGDYKRTISLRATGAYTRVTTGELVASGVPVIEGAALVGTTLTVDPGFWADGTTLSYQWFRNGAAVSDSNSASHAVTAGDILTRFVVTVTGTRLGYSTTSKRSVTSNQVRFQKLVLTPPPVISGNAFAGETLTANPGTWDADVFLQYQWFRNGVLILGETGPTFGAGNSDTGKLISVQVTGSKANFVSVVRVSAPLPIQLRTMTLSPTPQITGIARVGETLTVNVGTWDAGVSLNYVWKRSGTVILDAGNESTYVLTEADVARKITVVVTATRASYRTITKTTAATLKVVR
jgi:hypothetical protein